MTEFDKRLKSLKNSLQKPSAQEETKPLYSMALRASTDMISGIVAGTLLGYFVDVFFDFSPWGLIIGFLLGTAAGFLNVYRTVQGYGYKAGYSPSKSSIKDKT